jgi:hypothetical protein
MPRDDYDDRPSRSSDKSGDLTTVDWLLCIFCSGIGCIIGIIRLIQGDPTGGKMIGFSLLFSFLWGILRGVLTVATQQQGGAGP